MTQQGKMARGDRAAPEEPKAAKWPPLWKFLSQVVIALLTAGSVTVLFAPKADVMKYQLDQDHLRLANVQNLLNLIDRAHHGPENGIASQFAALYEVAGFVQKEHGPTLATAACAALQVYAKAKCGEREADCPWSLAEKLFQKS